MATLKVSTLLFSSSSSSSPLSCSSNRINAATHNSKLRRACISSSNLPTKNLVHEFNIKNGIFATTTTITNTILSKSDETTCPTIVDEPPPLSTDISTAKLYAILEAIADRVEMHKTIGEQRDNWNALLLSSINTITLSAATMAGLAASNTIAAIGVPLFAFKLSSTLLFCAATGMLMVMNKLQPSQLAEEQRSAARLFKQIYGEIEIILALRDVNQNDVNEAMEKVLALDKAYPLPLLGVMLEKFPLTFEPAIWWPSKHAQNERKVYEEREVNWEKRERNGWSEEMEVEMKEIVEVLKRKDIVDYVRLGNLVLKINKILAISSPILTGVAAVGASFSHGPVAVVAAALASVVNTIEHGGQVGMVFEMYRNSSGFFGLLQESIESTLEREVEKRENGELFEMKVGLKLGRSLSELRDLASSSASSHIDGNSIDEFASKLF
ncbi:probable F-box protein At4g22030 [Camellia sinensis]|uniref:F-box protein n=1 Tax=Camellia sinensis var. sinensis TaxID=542762 RepID=A0A4S4EAG4_CAMSN|nr:probable F-box protein At4g22030 [Camellia sinensis]THG12526.1 hypothetical protein TEA_016130 [Camellia sinensis var. sinensis]